jgi:hypothetical protein
MFAVLYMICQFVALTARQVAHGFLGLIILWIGWHAFMVHERHLHAGISNGPPAASHVGVALTTCRDCPSRDGNQHSLRRVSDRSSP